MIEIIEYALSGFWRFIGFIIILSIIGNFLFIVVNRIIRGFNIRKHGYPPSHCDADGDFKEDEK